jgi:hypothetical protein
VSIKQLIYDYLDEQSKYEKSQRKNRDYIYFGPSYTGKCGRCIYYSKTKTKESNPTPIHTYVKFALGDIVHEWLQDIFRKKNIWITGEEEIEINREGIDWVYRTDGCLILDKNNLIIEIKSVYGTRYRSISKEPDQNNVYQLLLYMEFENIEKGILFYIGRDNGYMIEYVLEDGKIWMENGSSRTFISNYPEIDFERLRKIKQNIKDKVLPKKDFQIYLKNRGSFTATEFTKDKKKYKTDWQCSFCNWKDLCWEKELKEIKNNKFYIDGKFIK